MPRYSSSLILLLCNAAIVSARLLSTDIPIYRTKLSFKYPVPCTPCSNSPILLPYSGDRTFLLYCPKITELQNQHLYNKSNGDVSIFYAPKSYLSAFELVGYCEPFTIGFELKFSGEKSSDNEGISARSWNSREIFDAHNMTLMAINTTQQRTLVVNETYVFFVSSESLVKSQTDLSNHNLTSLLYKDSICEMGKRIEIYIMDFGQRRVPRIPQPLECERHEEHVPLDTAAIRIKEAISWGLVSGLKTYPILANIYVRGFLLSLMTAPFFIPLAFHIYVWTTTGAKLIFLAAGSAFGMLGSAVRWIRDHALIAMFVYVFFTIAILLLFLAYWLDNEVESVSIYDGEKSHGEL